MKPVVLITGSEGLIGKVITPALRKEYAVYCVDRKGVPRKNFFKVDISHETKLASVFPRIGKVDTIVHLAADYEVNNISKWNAILKTNIIGTKNVYECAKKHQVKRIIFGSTNQITKGAEKERKKWPFEQKINISSSPRPLNDYATSKVFGEALARQYCDLYGIKSICLRIGTVFADDNSPHSRRELETWLSHKDLIQLIKKSLRAPVPFGIYYGVSKNKGRFWDIKNANRDLKFYPHDDSSKKAKN